MGRGAFVVMGRARREAIGSDPYCAEGLWEIERNERGWRSQAVRWRRRAGRLSSSAPVTWIEVLNNGGL